MTWITTCSGGRFDFANPGLTPPTIEDIAHHLARVNRFGGASRLPYSVARHSILVADIVARLGGTPGQQFAGLMHDASEAFAGDVCRPLKQMLPGYQEIERRVQASIVERFAVLDDEYTRELVHTADSMALVTEADRLLPGGANAWGAEWARIPRADDLFYFGRWEVDGVDFIARSRVLLHRRKCAA